MFQKIKNKICCRFNNIWQDQLYKSTKISRQRVWFYMLPDVSEMFLCGSLWSTSALEEAPEGWVTVGKQERGVHYKMRPSPDERQNI